MNTIRRLRKINGLTQKQLGNKVGKTEACICQYETGIREPPIRVAKKLATELGCKLEEIYEQTE